MKFKQSVFISGCVRSGTTYALSIFQNHPDVISTSESQAYLKLYQKVIYGQPFERLIEIYDKTFKYGENHKDEYGAKQFCNYINRKDFVELISIISKLNKSIEFKCKLLIKKIFESFYNNNGGGDKKVFVEKTPSHVFYTDHILKDFPGSKMIFLVRNPKDVCVSMESFNKWWCPKTRKEQVNKWLEYNNEVLKMHKKYPTKTMIIKYEDVLNDPETYIREMFTFTGLKYNTEIINNISEKTNFKNIDNKGKGKHLNKGISGNWKEKLNNKDIKIINGSIPTSMLKELGYDAEYLYITEFRDKGGLFACTNQVLDFCFYADIHKMKPVVYWDKKVFFGEKRDTEIKKTHGNIILNLFLI